MLQYIIVFGIVAVAAIYVGRTLWKESKGDGCVGCNCAAKGKKANDLVQIKGLDDKSQSKGRFSV
ncbi:MAG: FeoB-associated Cys-rich membrane protein [Candidatus Zixiibacteriota bacterium]